jgi:hypothetical protein
MHNRTKKKKPRNTQFDTNVKGKKKKKGSNTKNTTKNQNYRNKKIHQLFKV